MLLSLSAENFAQHAGTDQDEKACTHDVQRLCRRWMDQGDLTILACLKGNRTRLHPACREVLIRHGQYGRVFVAAPYAERLSPDFLNRVIDL